MLEPMEISESSEVLVRLGFFAALFSALILLEALLPRRARRVNRLQRWPGNIAISALNQVFVRLVLPVSTLALAATAQSNGWGLLASVALPLWAEMMVAVLLLDLAIYLQHRAYHAVPLLWRFHRMHHADVEFDVTTGIRFHPLSVLLSAVIKLAVILLIGAPVMAVLLFEVLLNATSLFNHSNLRLPLTTDSALRLCVVTPDMHRVHHSSKPAEHNCNFGFNFPWWDRLFRTYRAQPAHGHVDMQIGLRDFRESDERRLDKMLTQPFRSIQTK